MKKDKCMGKSKSRMECTGRLVASDDPCRSWQAFVDDLRYYTNIRIAVCGRDKFRIDVRYPKLRQSRVHSWQKKSENVEEESAVIPLFISEQRGAALRVSIPITAPA